MTGFFYSLRGISIRATAIIVLTSYNGLLWTLRKISPRLRPPQRNPTLLLTGSFVSPNWLAAHLEPITASDAFGKIWIVSEKLEYTNPSIEWVVPPSWLTRVIGSTASRLVTYSVLAFRHRPDWIAGFHLLFNGLFATFLARLLNRQSIHFCVGGPAEIVGGGIQSENRFFEKIGRPSGRIEKLLITAAGFADTIVFMGTSAKQHYIRNGYLGRAVVIPGGIRSPCRAPPSFADRDIDALYIGRLSKIKDLPLYIRTMAKVANANPGTKGIIVGDGEERQHLEDYTTQLKINDVVQFVGYQSSVDDWLGRAKVLVLTSYSEGLSLAVMEALSSGVPVVAPDVGDLRDAIKDNQTGNLVTSRDPAEFARAILSIILDNQKFDELSSSAMELATAFSIEATAEKWSNFVLSGTK